MPFGAVLTLTWVATFSACHSWICALLAMELYSRRGTTSETKTCRPATPKRDQNFDADRSIRRTGFWLSPARIRPVHQLAAFARGGVLHLLRFHLPRHFYSADMEPGRPPFRKLCRQLPLRGLPRGRDRARRSAAVVPDPMGPGQIPEVKADRCRCTPSTWMP